MQTPTPLQEAMSRRLIPVVTFERAEDAGFLGDTLVAAGLPCIEVTLRSPAAFSAIADLSRRGDLHLGAGTVLTIEQARLSVEAGAQFLFSPGFNARLVRFCLDLNIPIVPGVCTPSDVQTAMDHGLRLVKFFPAEAMGGAAMLQAVGAPYPMMRFVPTGGIGPQNLGGYLRLPGVPACGCSWLAPAGMIAARQGEAIRNRVREAAAIAAGTEPAATQAGKP